jgi:neutral ceramidase
MTSHRKIIHTHLFFMLMLSSLSSMTLAAAPHPDSCNTNTTFNIGAGIYDITGPAAEEGMMGYAMIKQQTAGLYQRLWARAFVIESPCNNKKVVFVNADLGQIFQGIKQQVVHKLHDKYGDRYNDSNVLITATHEHSGPGGYSTYTLYNLTTFGFSRKNFDTIVDGIVAAIERAQHNMTKGQIKVATGQVSGISFNRSPTAYLQNPQKERDRYQGDTDTQMTLLRFDTLYGKPIGMINWFPLHGVSMNNKNHLINGDNKGYAEYRFEKDFHSDYGPRAYVAAFAQANAGDVSPNSYGREGGEGFAGIIAIEKAGQPQYEQAKKLFDSATHLVTGGVDYRHTYVAMDQVTIDPKYTDGKWQMTCPAAIGVSMLAGTQDGEGIGKQGITCDTLASVVPHFACAMITTPCQGVKPIALQTGSMKPYPWTPNILPLQVFKIGPVVIAAAPFELTTMTGRRIKETIASVLPQSADQHIVLSALANAYSGYVATNEEYQIQRYEGASTHFGPWTSAALRQAFAKLTTALVKETVVDAGPMPLDLLGDQIDLQPGVVFDDKPIWQQFGDVYQNVNPHYAPGDTAQVVFWGGHPKNNYRTQDSFLEVQRLENDQWNTIRRDRDWDTEYHWQRKGVAYSLITIVWRIPGDMPAGQYRIVHHGDWKSAWREIITPYTGYSSVFTIG